MRKLLILAVSALLLASLVPDDAFAQRGRHGVAVHGGGFRSAGVRVGAVGWRGGRAWSDRRVAWRNPGWAGRRVVWGGDPWVGRRVVWGDPWAGRRVAWGWSDPGWRWRRGWGFPAAAGLAFAAASAPRPYYDSCLRWNGFRWVNVCYAPSYWGW